MKAIALLSGGLDSTLAIKLVREQGIEVTALNFTSPFCTCTKKGSSCSAAASAAVKLGVPLKVIPKGLDYFKVVENPEFGYASAMNPCIDCRIYILRKARAFMEEEGASFLITGEVVGQRPKSQKRDTLRLIEKQASLEGLLVRPLSAALLPATIPEKMGWLDRQRLLNISGRGRRPQIALADAFGIVDYPCPAGGCLLTDHVVADRLRDLFARKPDYDLTDITLLKYGRHFRLPSGRKLVLSRSQREGLMLGGFFRSANDLFFRCTNPAGPEALLKDANRQGMEPDIEICLSIIHRYSKAADNSKLHVLLEGLLTVGLDVFRSIPESQAAEYMV